MYKDDSSTKEKLIEAVLQLLTIKSAHILTIREIANHANVNSASISYYFGSKESLIAEASTFYWNKWDNILEELEDNDNGSPVERLRKCLNSYINFILKYEGIFKSYIAKIISQSEYDYQASQNIKRLSCVVKNIIREHTNITNEQVLKFKTISVLSSIAYPTLLGKYGETTIELNIYDDEVIKDYIDELVESVMK